MKLLLGTCRLHLHVVAVYAVVHTVRTYLVTLDVPLVSVKGKNKRSESQLSTMIV